MSNVIQKRGARNLTQRHTHSVHMSKVKNDASRRSRPPTDPRPLLRLIPLPSSTQVTPCLAWRRARRVGRRVDGDSEARRVGIRNSEPASGYILSGRRLPHRSAPVGLCHSLFFFFLHSLQLGIQSSSAAFGAVRWQSRAARGGLRLAFCQTEAEL